MKSSSGESITSSVSGVHPYRIPAPLPLPLQQQDFPLRKTGNNYITTLLTYTKDTIFWTHYMLVFINVPN